MIKPHHIDQAYQWVCEQRRNYPENADIWHLRFHWQSERARILQSLCVGNYDFAPLQVIAKADGTIIHLWRSPDALVLKALTLAIAPLLPISRRCTHVKGHGGLKYAVRDVRDNIAEYDFVMRTDVKAYYDSIDCKLLLDKLAAYIKDRFILNLLWQSMRRCIEYGGVFREIKRGIPRGCPLSPLLGAFYLTDLDNCYVDTNCFYVRYMDDILIMTKSRWSLRRAVRRLNRVLNQLNLEKHPDKTFIGRITRGFDFLGYNFEKGSLKPAEKTIAKALVTLTRLYEQKDADPERLASLGAYYRRWRGWVRGGLLQLGEPGDRPSITYPSLDFLLKSLPLAIATNPSMVKISM